MAGREITWRGFVAVESSGGAHLGGAPLSAN